MDLIFIRLGSGGHPALKKTLVRRALAYGIDRQQIVRELFRKTVPSQRVADSTIFPSSSPYYRPNWSRYRYRSAEARRLLEQAGCRRGADGVYVCAGERLSLRFLTRADPGRVRTLELVQSQLRQAGVEVVPTFGSGDVIAEILGIGNFDLVEWAYVTVGDTANLAFDCGAPYNFTGYCQRLVTADLNEAGLSLDAEERARILNRADARMANDVPVLPLYRDATVTALRRNLRGVVFPGDLFGNAENWWLAPER